MVRVETPSVISHGVGKTSGNRPSGKSKQRWEDNIRMDITEIGSEELGLFGSGYDLLESPSERSIVSTAYGTME